MAEKQGDGSKILNSTRDVITEPYRRINRTNSDHSQSGAERLTRVADHPYSLVLPRCFPAARRPTIVAMPQCPFGVQ